MNLFRRPPNYLPQRQTQRISWISFILRHLPQSLFFSSSLSNMTGPRPSKPTLAKPLSKTRRAGNKLPKGPAEIQNSPLTTAQASFTPDRPESSLLPFSNKDPNTTSEDAIVAQQPTADTKSPARRVLDFSNISVRSQTTGTDTPVSTVTTLGELAFHVSTRLQELERDPRFLGKQVPNRFRLCKVILTVIPIRVPDFTSSFSFVLFADYTGFISIGAKTALFTKSPWISDFDSANQQMIPRDEVTTVCSIDFSWVLRQAFYFNTLTLAIFRMHYSQMSTEGFVSFSRSKSNEDELFLAFNDGQNYKLLRG